MTASVTATSIDYIIPTKIGASRVLLQNVASSTITITFHQGFTTDGSGNPYDVTPNQLPPGESIMLDLSRPVFVNSVSNAAGTFLFGYFA